MHHTVEEVKLPNGTQGLLVDVPDAPVMTFNFNFRAGYFTSPKDKWEVPHVLEHLMFNGNRYHKTAHGFQLELDKNGAYANAFTNNWYVGYDSECAEFESMRILELVLQSLCSPLFLEHEFKSEMGNVREELSGYLNNYFRVLNLAMMENAKLLALNDSARINQLSNVENDDMLTHHHATHTQANVRFVIGGQTRKHQQDIMHLIEKYSAQLPKGTRLELPGETPAAKQEALVIERQDVEKLHYYFDMYLPDYRLTKLELGVANIVERILTRTMSSKIFGEARRQGLAYGINSSTTTGTDNSRWWFGGNVGHQNAPLLFKIIVKEISALAHGNISVEEVEAAKLQALGNFQRSSQKTSEITRWYEQSYYFDGDIEDHTSIPEEINSITKEHIVAFVQRFIQQKSWDVGLLGRVGETLPRDVMKICATLFD